MKIVKFNICCEQLWLRFLIKLKIWAFYPVQFLHSFWWRVGLFFSYSFLFLKDWGSCTCFAGYTLLPQSISLPDCWENAFACCKAMAFMGMMADKSKPSSSIWCSWPGETLGNRKTHRPFLLENVIKTKVKQQWLKVFSRHVNTCP